MTPESALDVSGRMPRVSVRIALVFTLIALAIHCGAPMIGAAFANQTSPLLPFWLPRALASPGCLLAKADLSKGKFLVASRQLRDPKFSETVILLIEYDRKGAMGLIINRPTKVRLSSALPEIEGLQQRRDTVYLGGPVATNQVRLLIRSSSQPEGARRVLEEVYLSSSRSVLQQMIDDADAQKRFRVYAGYAGWGPGQLDFEISRGGWHVLPADAGTVFDTAASEIWPELIRRTSVQWAGVRRLDRNAGPLGPDSLLD